MKQLAFLKPHSVVSLITNSSTELFVCNTKETVESVKEILQKIIDGYNLMNDSSYDMSMFDEPFIFNLKEYREWKTKEKKKKNRDWNHKFGTIEGWFHDDEDAKEMEEMRKHVIEWGTRIPCFLGWTNDDREYRGRIDAAARNNKKKEYDWTLAKKEIEKIYKEILKSKDKPEWWNEPWKHQWGGTLAKELDGCIILCGSSDNSIPYDIWDFINNKLNARNFHLG